MGLTYVKNNLLFILFSNLTQCSVFFFVKSGSPRKGEGSQRANIVYPDFWNRRLKSLNIKNQNSGDRQLSFLLLLFFLFSCFSSSFSFHFPALVSSSNSGSSSHSNNDSSSGGSNSTSSSSSLIILLLPLYNAFTCIILLDLQ